LSFARVGVKGVKYAPKIKHLFFTI
jgi:hypothetical protein